MGLTSTGRKSEGGQGAVACVWGCKREMGLECMRRLDGS